MLRFCLIFSLFGYCLPPALASDPETDQFSGHRKHAEYQQQLQQQPQLYYQLLKELRCPRCDGQSIAESNAAVARSIKNQVQALVVSGKSKAEIKAYLVERYGETILFEPAFNGKNIILWLAPTIVLIVFFSWFVRLIFFNC